jgi:hypothetical protein
VKKLPKKGDVFSCPCGMRLEITHDCKCDSAEEVKMECCGQEMELMAPSKPPKPPKT